MTAMILLREWQASQIEFWKVIPGMPEHEVSNFGRVRSWHGAFGRRPKPLMLKLAIHHQGYRYVEPQYSGKRKFCFVHRLVALAFLPNPDGLPEVNHKTGLKSDNRLAGLEWVSSRGNCQHSVKFGLKVSTRGIQQAYRVFTPEQVCELRLRFAQGQTKSELARAFKVHRITIARAISRETYAKVA